MSQIQINSLQKQPVDASDDVLLIPPGAIKVADKTGADLFALRFNSDDLVGTLNGAISSQGTGHYTCGILFQDDSDEYLNGSLMFSSGKMAVSSTGAEYANGIEGNELGISGAVGSPLSGSLKVSAKSATKADATGIYADARFESDLALKIDVKADATKGTDAKATGLDGDITTLAISDKFKLNIQAKSGTGDAIAMGINESLVGTGPLSGTFDVKSDASKGDDASAYGVLGDTSVTDISDKFKLTIQAKAGTDEAYAYAFNALTATGQLGGTVTVKADASKGTRAKAVGLHGKITAEAVSDKFKLNVQAKAGSADATAIGFEGSLSEDGQLGGSINLSATNSKSSTGMVIAIAFYSNVTTASISDKFKLVTQAKSVSAKAGAGGFFDKLEVSGIIGGTITISAESSTGDTQAFGFSNLQATGFSDRFKLTVKAKNKTGSVAANGFGTIDIAEGLSGKINISALSTSGSANACGGKFSSLATLKTGTANEFVVTAQTGNLAIQTTAYGFTGDIGVIDLQGKLAVTAKGFDSTAWGIHATTSVTGSISGVVAVVANSASGVWSYESSDLTISGAVYAGNKGNAASIAKSLGKLIGTGKSAAGLNKNADQALELGDSSTLTLTDGSIVIGDIKLGENSTLNLSTGSQLYGDIDMSGSGDLNITIDGVLSKAAMVTLDSAGAGVFTPTSGVNLTITATDVSQTGKYVLLAGSDLSELTNVDFDTLFHLEGFDTQGLAASWVLDTDSKTDTLTLVLSDAPAGSSSALLSATDFNSADRMLASSSLTDEVTTSGANAWKNALIA